MVSLQDSQMADESVDLVGATQADDDVVLSVRGVSKKFCRDLKRSLLYGVQDIASEMTGLRGRRDELRKKEFWALDNVSFELRRGEALGLVGKNGSGKSTLLRVIAGLIKPDAGEVEIRGRVAPLIALGAGFNPILTGRENVYANMSILGLSKKEIDDRFDEVVEFAEIGDAMDSPVQSYSSGMAARLGFSCAIHTEPDILLIDEVLAVGDVRFRERCHKKLHSLRKNTSFILVTHSAPAILKVCEKSVYLRNGHLLAYGESHSILSDYESDLFSQESKGALGHVFLPPKSPSETEGLDILEVFFEDKYGSNIESPVTGNMASLCIRSKCHRNINDVSIYLNVGEIGGEHERVLLISNSYDKENLEVPKGLNELKIVFPCLSLRPGLYESRLLIREEGIKPLDLVESFRFRVESSLNLSRSLFYQPREWKVVSSENIN